MKSLVRPIHLEIVALIILGVSATSFAQSYPNRPIRLIVPTSPGGATDMTARLVGQNLSPRLGQPVVVENKPGAGNNIGTEAVAKATPDGYTFLMGTIANAINYRLYRNLPFDFIKDFAPVTQLTAVQSFLVVHPSLPVRSVKELIALAKAKPGNLSYASSGIGNSPHLAGEMFKMMVGIDMVHIPYKGTGPELTDLLAGHVKIAFETTPAVLSHVKAGKLLALAVNSAKRTPLLPDVQTMSEAGVPGFEVTSWNGLVFPAGTPKEIVTRIWQETVKVLTTPDVRENFLSLGATPIGNTPEQFGVFIQEEVKKWAKVIEDANVKVE